MTEHHWIVAATSEEFARSYVDRAMWRAFDRTLVCANSIAASKIEQECSAVLVWAKAKVSGPVDAPRPVPSEVGRLPVEALP